MARVTTRSRGPGDDALLDGAPELDVVVERALGAEVALGGDPGAERRRRVRHRAGDAEAERLLQHLVVPQRLVVGMQEEMRVPLDEPGNGASYLAASIRSRRPAPRPGLGADGGDRVPLDQHHPAALRRVGDAVPHRVGHQERRRSAVGLGRWQLRRKAK